MKTILASFALIFWATVSLAHQLNVFAFVEDGMVVVESKYSSGRVPVTGEVKVLDAENVLIMVLPLEEDGTARFALDMDVAGAGLLIEVATGGGHDNYWILTPDDIALGMES